MLVFNPEHDLCIANGSPYFVPPEVALKFGRDCAGIMSIIADDSLDRIIPWGWNAVLKERLRKQGVSPDLLPSDEMLNDIRSLSHRRIAVEATEFLREALDDEKSLVRESPAEVNDVEAVEECLGKYGSVILKSPWSGSGRGLRPVRKGELFDSDRGWCRRVISRQGSLIVEKREDVVQDFAMLFDVGKADVTFEGYSLFFCENGAYRGNLLASDASILERLSQYVQPDLLDKVREELLVFIRRRFLGKYEGCVGADMFICRDSERETHYLLRPVVELNVRMTMGLLAHRVYERLMRQIPVTQYSKMTVEYAVTPAELREKLARLSAVPLIPLPDDATYAVCGGGGGIQKGGRPRECRQGCRR